MAQQPLRAQTEHSPEAWARFQVHNFGVQLMVINRVLDDRLALRIDHKIKQPDGVIKTQRLQIEQAKAREIAARVRHELHQAKPGANDEQRQERARFHVDDILVRILAKRSVNGGRPYLEISQALKPTQGERFTQRLIIDERQFQDIATEAEKHRNELNRLFPEKPQRDPIDRIARKQPEPNPTSRPHPEQPIPKPAARKGEPPKSAKPATKFPIHDYRFRELSSHADQNTRPYLEITHEVREANGQTRNQQLVLPKDRAREIADRVQNELQHADLKPTTEPRREWARFHVDKFQVRIMTRSSNQAPYLDISQEVHKPFGASKRQHFVIESKRFHDYVHVTPKQWFAVGRIAEPLGNAAVLRVERAYESAVDAELAARDSPLILITQPFDREPKKNQPYLMHARESKKLENKLKEIQWRQATTTEAYAIARWHDRGEPRVGQRIHVETFSDYRNVNVEKPAPERRATPLGRSRPREEQQPPIFLVYKKPELASGPIEVAAISHDQTGAQTLMTELQKKSNDHKASNQIANDDKRWRAVDLDPKLREQTLGAHVRSRDVGNYRVDYFERGVWLTRSRRQQDGSIQDVRTEYSLKGFRAMIKTKLAQEQPKASPEAKPGPQAAKTTQQPRPKPPERQQTTTRPEFLSPSGPTTHQPPLTATSQPQGRPEGQGTDQRPPRPQPHTPQPVTKPRQAPLPSSPAAKAETAPKPAPAADGRQDHPHVVLTVWGAEQLPAKGDDILFKPNEPTLERRTAHPTGSKEGWTPRQPESPTVFVCVERWTPGPVGRHFGRVIGLTTNRDKAIERTKVRQDRADRIVRRQQEQEQQEQARKAQEPLRNVAQQKPFKPRF